MPHARYTRDHEWVRLHDGQATVGVTGFAVEALGGVVLVRLPAPGRRLRAGEACAVIESVKAASDTYAPLAGRVSAVNAAVAADPALVNQDPQGEGWLYRITPDEPGAFGALLDEFAYDELIRSL